MSANPSPLPDLQADVMTAAEAAKVLGMHSVSIRRAAGRGELPARRIGSRYLFSRAALSALKIIKILNERGEQ